MTLSPPQVTLDSSQRGSLRSILEKHPSLIVDPLGWTEDHLNHLSCRLGEVTRYKDDSNTENRRSSQWWQAVGAIWDMENCCVKKKSKDQAMRRAVLHLTAEAGLNLKSGSLALRYNNRISNIKLLLFYKHRWAYMDETWCCSQRRSFRTARDKRNSDTTRLIQQTKNLALDPLYAAILIGLAQDNKNMPFPRAVSLFVTRHDKVDGKFVTTVMRYHAKVSEEYLKKFEDPSNFHDCTLDIFPTQFGADQLGRIMEAIQEASGKAKGA